jgi:enoyl-CoA hydratase/carnithine racemase
MNEAFARLCSTEDAKEGVAAFFGKRNPEWKLR